MKLISDETYARIAHMTWNELAHEYEKLEGIHDVLRETVQQAVDKIYNEDDPDAAKPWLVENVLGLLVEALATDTLLTAKETP